MSRRSGLLPLLTRSGVLALALALAVLAGPRRAEPATIPTCADWALWTEAERVIYVHGIATGIAVLSLVLEEAAAEPSGRLGLNPSERKSLRDRAAPQGRVSWIVDEIGLVCRRDPTLALVTAYRLAARQMAEILAPRETPNPYDDLVRQRFPERRPHEF